LVHPDDKYGPSRLVFGVTEAGRPLHFQYSQSLPGDPIPTFTLPMKGREAKSNDFIKLRNHDAESA